MSGGYSLPANKFAPELVSAVLGELRARGFECIAATDGKHEPIANPYPAPAAGPERAFIVTAYHAKRSGNGELEPTGVNEGMFVEFCRHCGALYVPKGNRRPMHSVRAPLKAAGQ